MRTSIVLCLACATVAMCRSFPQGDLDTAPSYKKPQDGYFQYVNVPAVKEYEFGWNRGNPNHYISRYEQNKDHRFRTRVRWGDNVGGYGEHYWEYNHGPEEYKEPVAYVDPKPTYGGGPNFA